MKTLLNHETEHCSLTLLSIIVVLLAVAIISCDSNTNADANLYVQDIVPSKDLPDELIIVTIPTTGCQSCIGPALSFLNENVENERFMFVITEIQDNKALRNDLGTEIYNNINLIIDRDNLWRKAGLAKEYPLIIRLKNGEISQVVYSTTENKKIWQQLI